jgi:hypothetical protein
MVKGNILVENKQCKIWNYDEVKEDAEIAAKILLKEAGYEKMLPTRMPGSSFHNWQYI